MSDGDDNDERRLFADMQDLYDQYNKLVRQQQELYTPLLSALTELLQSRQRLITLGSPALYQLPVVPKQIQRGPRGGMKYINSKGNIVWLKKSQRKRCAEGRLAGAGSTCGSVIDDAMNDTDGRQERRP